MESSVFIAKIIGPLFIIVAVGLLLNLKYYQRVLEEFAKSPALLYLGGFNAFIFGILIVLFHNVWQLQWPVVITILGWMGLIKGVALLVFPDVMARLSSRYTKSSTSLIVQSAVILVLGVFLTVMGYWG